MRGRYLPCIVRMGGLRVVGDATFPFLLEIPIVEWFYAAGNVIMEPPQRFPSLRDRSLSLHSSSNTQPNQ